MKVDAPGVEVPVDDADAGHLDGQLEALGERLQSLLVALALGDVLREADEPDDVVAVVPRHFPGREPLLVQRRALLAFDEAFPALDHVEVVLVGFRFRRRDAHHLVIRLAQEHVRVEERIGHPDVSPVLVFDVEVDVFGDLLEQRVQNRGRTPVVFALTASPDRRVNPLDQRLRPVVAVPVDVAVRVVVECARRDGRIRNVVTEHDCDAFVILADRRQ